LPEFGLRDKGLLRGPENFVQARGRGK